MKALEDNLGYTFQDPTLLKKAITHPSALAPGQGVNFERLEFLGDRVLGLVIASWLYEKHPHETEGDLAKRLANLVRKETLVKVAQTIGLPRALVMKKETSSSTQKRLETLLADGCEALIGALYLEGGIAAAQSFIHRHWEETLQEDLEPPRDAKSILQEWAQGQGKLHPTYVVLESSGPAHAPHFVVEVHIEGFDPVKGTGSSKKLAEKNAAQHLLDMIFAS